MVELFEEHKQIIQNAIQNQDNYTEKLTYIYIFSLLQKNIIDMGAKQYHITNDNKYDPNMLYIFEALHKIDNDLINRIKDNEPKNYKEVIKKEIKTIYENIKSK